MHILDHHLIGYSNKTFHYCINQSQVKGSSLSQTEILVALATLVTAIAALVISWQQYKNSKNDSVNAVHTRYLELITIASKEKVPFNNRVKQLYANFYEYVAWLLIRNRICEKDIELFESDLKNPKIVAFITSRRTQNPNWYKFYWSWYEQNQKR